MFNFHDPRSIIHSRVIVFTGRKTDTQTHKDMLEHSVGLFSKSGDMCLYDDLINKSDVQIFRICGNTTRLPKIRLIRPSENQLV